jgi:hypothetical protein
LDSPDGDTDAVGVALFVDQIVDSSDGASHTWIEQECAEGEGEGERRSGLEEDDSYQTSLTHTPRMSKPVENGEWRGLKWS